MISIFFNILGNSEKARSKYFKAVSHVQQILAASQNDS